MISVRHPFPPSSAFSHLRKAEKQQSGVLWVAGCWRLAADDWLLATGCCPSRPPLPLPKSPPPPYFFFNALPSRCLESLLYFRLLWDKRHIGSVFLIDSCFECRNIAPFCDLTQCWCCGWSTTLYILRTLGLIWGFLPNLYDANPFQR